MSQAACVDFLKWAMPRLGLAWPGFRRVHRQVCRRLGHRLAELGLADFADYRNYLLAHDTEWSAIDACCRITVSQFYRNPDVFDALTAKEIPSLAAAARARGTAKLRFWSAGCAAGEEAYSLVFAWTFGVAAQYPELGLEVIGTDIDEVELSRARQGCYRPSSLVDLPEAWRTIAFQPTDGGTCLRPEYRQGVEFRRQDVRADAPPGPFDLILCRNLAFTYFDVTQQNIVLAILLRELAPHGRLVIGRSESLPGGVTDLITENARLRIFRHVHRALAA